MCKTVHDEIELRARPRAVYDAYLDSRSHAKFTGAPARMSRIVGRRFSAGGNYISGYNLDLVPGKRIVQAWRASEWPKGVFSVITIALRPIRNGTRLVFDQRGIPEDVDGASTTEEWAQYYWAPLKEYLEASG